MFFGRNKKGELHKGDVFLAKGIYLKQPVMKNGNVLMNCFLRAFVVFLLTYGSIGAFLSAFSIAYNALLVICIYLWLSVYFSWLYTLPKFYMRDVGYILFFAAFVFSIVRLRYFANSGFYEIVNRIMEVAQGYFNLAGVRQYEIAIDKPYLTVAIVACFVGMVFIILLNIWLSASASVGWSVMITFPMLCIPLYMELVPNVFYVIILMTGYFLVVTFKANGHYIASPKGVSFYIKGLKKNRITYTQDSKTFRQVVLRIFLAGICLVLLSVAVFPENMFKRMFKNDPLREQTSELVGNFVLRGFGAFYNRYAGAGGMSGGKLGGISNVTPDYQPDLIVTFAPFSNEAMYLKAYTGGRYGDNEWEDIYADSENMQKYDDIEIFEDDSMKNEAMALRQKVYDADVHGGMGKMKITNVGADSSYMYYPYYTLFPDYGDFNNYGMMRTKHGIFMNDHAIYNFYPKLVWEEQLGKMKPSEQDLSNVNTIFLEVPDKNEEVLAHEIAAMGITDSMSVNEIVDTMRTYFSDNIPYTLRPGSTPRDEDFVNYFLTKNRKGYCAHFATTATLMFRQLGIPARYVEGYAFGLEAALASEENTLEKYFDYYDGYAPIGESTVLDVEVTDAMAHAWVEIYIDGFGWKVVEVTPGSNEASDESDFWSAFTSALNVSDFGDGWDSENLFGKIDFKKYWWLMYVVIAIVSVVFVWKIAMLLARKTIRFYRCHVGERKENIIAYYADLCDMIRVLDASFNSCRSHKEQLMYMKEHYALMLDVTMCCEQLEEISFSEHLMDDTQLQVLYGLLRTIRKSIWKNADWKKCLQLIKR
ncbi:MAG: transglutaminase domain-containing protein [Lachnospiraceae bacterium]|nr:transglutaminase domain-containing protein [Lachnospiraceae bacterium]